MGYPKGDNRTGIKARQPQSGVKVDTDIIKQAIIKSRGNLSRAADRLGVCRQTLYLRVNKEPEIKAVVDGCRERFLDDAEDVLQSKVLSGDTTTLLFTLKQLGRKRGYDFDNSSIAESTTKGVLDFIVNRSKNPAELI